MKNLGVSGAMSPKDISTRKDYCKHNEKSFLPKLGITDSPRKLSDTDRKHVMKEWVNTTQSPYNKITLSGNLKGSKSLSVTERSPGKKSGETSKVENFAKVNEYIIKRSKIGKQSKGSMMTNLDVFKTTTKSFIQCDSLLSKISQNIQLEQKREFYIEKDENEYINKKKSSIDSTKTLLMMQEEYLTKYKHIPYNMIDTLKMVQKPDVNNLDRNEFMPELFKNIDKVMYHKEKNACLQKNINEDSAIQDINKGYIEFYNGLLNRFNENQETGESSDIIFKRRLEKLTKDSKKANFNNSQNLLDQIAYHRKINTKKETELKKIQEEVEQVTYIKSLEEQVGNKEECITKIDKELAKIINKNDTHDQNLIFLQNSMSKQESLGTIVTELIRNRGEIILTTKNYSSLNYFLNGPISKDSNINTFDCGNASKKILFSSDKLEKPVVVVNKVLGKQTVDSNHKKTHSSYFKNKEDHLFEEFEGSDNELDNDSLGQDEHFSAHNKTSKISNSVRKNTESKNQDIQIDNLSRSLIGKSKNTINMNKTNSTSKPLKSEHFTPRNMSEKKKIKISSNTERLFIQENDALLSPKTDLSQEGVVKNVGQNRNRFKKNLEHLEKIKEGFQSKQKKLQVMMDVHGFHIKPDAEDEVDCANVLKNSVGKLASKCFVSCNHNKDHTNLPNNKTNLKNRGNRNRLNSKQKNSESQKSIQKENTENSRPITTRDESKEEDRSSQINRNESGTPKKKQSFQAEFDEELLFMDNQNFPGLFKGSATEQYMKYRKNSKKKQLSIPNESQLEKFLLTQKEKFNELDKTDKILKNELTSRKQEKYDIKKEMKLFLKDQANLCKLTDASINFGKKNYMSSDVSENNIAGLENVTYGTNNSNHINFNKKIPTQNFKSTNNVFSSGSRFDKQILPNKFSYATSDGISNIEHVNMVHNQSKFTLNSNLDFTNKNFSLKNRKFSKNSFDNKKIYSGTSRQEYFGKARRQKMSATLNSRDIDNIAPNPKLEFVNNTVINLNKLIHSAKELNDNNEKDLENHMKAEKDYNQKLEEILINADVENTNFDKGNKVSQTGYDEGNKNDKADAKFKMQILKRGSGGKMKSFQKSGIHDYIVKPLGLTISKRIHL